MTEEEKRRQIAELMDGPKRKPGRPAGAAVPATFEDAMAALRPAEAQFVRHVLAGRDQKEAYALTHPKSRTPKAQQKSGSLLAARERVKHALSLGRKSGAVQAITGLKYSIIEANDEINTHIQTAIKQENMNAVASLVREKLKIHRLTDNSPAAAAGASFTLVIQNRDGEVKTINPAHVIDITPVEPNEGGGSE